MGLFSSINNKYNFQWGCNALLLCFIAVVSFSCTQKKYANPRIQIETKYGIIEAELYPDKAPQTCAAGMTSRTACGSLSGVRRSHGGASALGGVPQGDGWR